MPLNGITYVTVATDASVSYQNQEYGIAFYIRDDKGIHKHASVVKLPPEHSKNSRDAEFYALYAALQFIAKQKYAWDTKIIYYADNTTVLRVINDGFTPKTRKKYVGLIEYTAKILTGYHVETRHVKAHTGKKDLKKYYMNDWCDRNARSMVRHGRLYKARDWRKEKQL